MAIVLDFINNNLFSNNKTSNYAKRKVQISVYGYHDADRHDGDRHDGDTASANSAAIGETRNTKYKT